MRFSKLLFLFVLGLIPVQLNKFFFIDESYVLGIPIDYLAPSLYLSEIVLVLLIISTTAKPGPLIAWAKNKKGFAISAFVLSTYLLVASWFNPGSQIIGTIFSLKVLSLAAFSFVAAFYLSNKKNIPGISLVFYFSMLWQSLLIFLQVITQKSLGLWFLGERSFDAATVNIAHFNFYGRELLRPYGTFPHPNITAAFLLTMLLVTDCINERKSGFHKIITVLVSIAIVLTFSKTAIILLAGFFLLNSKNIALKSMIFLVAVISAIVLFEPAKLVPVASIAERLMLSEASLDISLINPVFGVGTNNFIRYLAALDLNSLSQTRLLQPVHNVFLLILAENGILGLLLFCIVLFFALPKTMNRHKTFLFLSLITILTIDHFTWTIHQGRVVFWFILGFLLSFQVAIQPAKKLK